MDDTRPETYTGDAAALLAAAMPGCAPELAQRLLMEVCDTLGLSGAPEDEADDAAKVAAALQMIQAAAPRDPLEAMLAAQMAACHGAAMRALRQAAKCADYPKIEALYARQAARLMQLYSRQTEALERRHARQDAAEARETDTAAAETGARPIAVRARSAKPPRSPRPPKRPPARCNGAPSPRNGRHHKLNGTSPPV